MNTLITSYTSQIDELNSQIAQLAPTVSTPITAQPLQHNPELARELGFNTSTDLDTNPWSAARDDWQVDNDFNQVDLHADTPHHQQQQQQTEERLPKTYVWENDLDVKECRSCRRKFGFLVRRHHCRCCGLIHCDRCSMSRAYLDTTQILQDPNGPLESLEVLSSQHQRVCDTCYAKLGGIPP